MNCPGVHCPGCGKGGAGLGGALALAVAVGVIYANLGAIMRAVEILLIAAFALTGGAVVVMSVALGVRIRRELRSGAARPAPLPLGGEARVISITSARAARAVRPTLPRPAIQGKPLGHVPAAELGDGRKGAPLWRS
jgi:hypothetical protein